MSEQSILVLGAIAYDYIMEFDGEFHNNLSISAPDAEEKKFQLVIVPKSKTINWGGTGGNIGFHLGKIGGNVKIITSVGKDFKTLEYEAQLSQFPNMKLDVDIYENEFTASCYIVNDNNHNQTIIFTPGAQDHSLTLKLSDKGINKENTKMAIVSPEGIQSMVNWCNELSKLEIPFIFDPGQMAPYFNREDLKEILSKCHLFIGNEHELDIILNTIGLEFNDLNGLCNRMIITYGAEGSKYFHETEESSEMREFPIVKPNKVQDTTGAGDAYRAGLLYGLENGLDIEKACQIGAVISSFVVESIGPQNTPYTSDNIKERYKDTFEEEFPI